MTRAVLLLLALPLAAAPALASSPEAWRAHDAKARAACTAASGLRSARASPPVLFGDASAKTAVLVTGTWPQAHMKGRPGAMLCLYDRRSGRTEASEAASWRPPSR